MPWRPTGMCPLPLLRIARAYHNRCRRGERRRATGKSSGSCPGYVIDHVEPLKRGGADASANMQWQTQRGAKLKDRTE